MTKNKEHPIIFSTDMIKVILDGRKTQTRRIIKPQPHYEAVAGGGCFVWDGKNDGYPHSEEVTKSIMIKHCPYGQVGSRLWVRETYFAYHCGHYLYLGDCSTGRIRPFPHNEIKYKATDTERQMWLDPYIRKIEKHEWKSASLMPRWASRITLEITNVRVERLQEITVADMIAEGINMDSQPFKLFWDFLNAKRGYGWNKNPFVWVINFKRIKED